MRKINTMEWQMLFNSEKSKVIKLEQEMTA